MTVKEAADLLGIDQQTVRIGMQEKQLPIGFCIGKGKRKRYVIPDELFRNATGIGKGENKNEEHC